MVARNPLPPPHNRRHGPNNHRRRRRNKRRTAHAQHPHEDRHPLNLAFVGHTSGVDDVVLVSCPGACGGEFCVWGWECGSWFSFPPAFPFPSQSPFRSQQIQSLTRTAASRPPPRSPPRRDKDCLLSPSHLSREFHFQE